LIENGKECKAEEEYKCLFNKSETGNSYILGFKSAAGSYLPANYFCIFEYPELGAEYENYWVDIKRSSPGLEQQRNDDQMEHVSIKY